MITVVTGMVGIDKKKYIDEVVALCKSRGKNVEVCSVGDMMYAEAKDIPAGRILDLPLKHLQALRRSVFKDIIKKSREVEHLIVNTHATFRWKHGLFPAIDMDQMRELGAELYICIIDGVDALHLRLSKEHHIKHTLKDLIVWREEEVLGTQMLCGGVSDDGKYYSLSRGVESATTETFYRLMFESYRRRVYLSYPMTHVAALPDVRETIRSFCAKMKEYFICFDPSDIEEAYLPYYGDDAEAKGLDVVEVEVLGEKITLALEQVRQIRADISSQIYARDFALIDQSHMIISFIPAMPDGAPAISSGVERELQHAHETAKDVYVIWLPKADPSVFVSQTATKVFRSIEEAKTFFEKEGLLHE